MIQINRAVFVCPVCQKKHSMMPAEARARIKRTGNPEICCGRKCGAEMRRRRGRY